jgi:peroxiredoxin
MRVSGKAFPDDRRRELSNPRIFRMIDQFSAAPEWDVEEWMNTDHPLNLTQLRGRVVVLGAFQMLCPGCVEYCIPQLKRAYAYFPQDEVAVIGMHTVFEHHGAMTPEALRAFLHEYRVAFPVAVDRSGGTHDRMPRTMRRYKMQGTPTTILIDRAGHLRTQTFGHIPDLQFGAAVMALMRESMAPSRAAESAGEPEDDGSAPGCHLPAGLTGSIG